MCWAKPLPNGANYGESWEISDHPSHLSIVAWRTPQGQTCGDLMEREPAALLGEAAGRYPPFPWLVKLLDAWDWLSVQVHPERVDVVGCGRAKAARRKRGSCWRPHRRAGIRRPAAGRR